MYALVAGLVASPMSNYYSAATTTDNPALHMCFWTSQFWVSGFDIEIVGLILGYSVLDIVVPLVIDVPLPTLHRRRGLYRGGEIARPRRVFRGSQGLS